MTLLSCLRQEDKVTNGRRDMPPIMSDLITVKFITCMLTLSKYMHIIKRVPRYHCGRLYQLVFVAYSEHTTVAKKGRNNPRPSDLCETF